MQMGIFMARLSTPYRAVGAYGSFPRVRRVVHLRCCTLLAVPVVTMVMLRMVCSSMLRVISSGQPMEAACGAPVRFSDCEREPEGYGRKRYSTTSIRLRAGLTQR